jgi:hypothetical protein
MVLSRVTEKWDFGIIHYSDPRWRFSGLQSNDYRAVSDSTSWAVIVNFPRFGGGQKKSDFQVAVKWEDVQTIIHKFCEAGQPEAIALQEARPTSSSCQRRSKNASVGRSKNTSVPLARRPPNWGPFRQVSSLGGIIRWRVRAGTA